MNRLNVSTLFVMSLLLAAGAANAAGFGDGYTLYHGDLNGDGRKDLYVKAPAKKVVPIMVDDLSVPLVLCCDVTDFVLQNDGARGFTIVGNLSAAQRSTLSAWPSATDLDLWYRDVDRDGRRDLEITSINSLVTDSFDQIVYGGAANQPPSGLTSKNIKFQRYHEQVYGWKMDHQYFENTAPWVVDTVQPGGPVQWFASVGDPTNVLLMNQFLSDCMAFVAPYGNTYTCLTTSSLPPGTQCNQPSVIIYDNAGNIVGQGSDNICSKPVHIVIFRRTLVTWKKDYSKHDQDARETADILLRIELGCPVFSDGDMLGLRNILERNYQRVLGSILGRADKPNSFPHAPFPGDELFDKNDVTFHHYDQFTRICTLSQANCTLAIVRDNVFRRFSYPAFKLAPTLTTINPPPGPYPTLMAFVTAPGADGSPGNYILPAGLITQKFVYSQPWEGAIQNVTTVAHISYPGTISRYVWQRDNALNVFTHGTGINRAFCTLAMQYRQYNLLLGTLNDMFGPKQFGQLDKQMIKYWNRNHGPGVGKIDPVIPYTGPVNPKGANTPLP